MSSTKKYYICTNRVPSCKLQTNTMAQIVKAVKMIVGRDKLDAPSRKQPKVLEGEIEIEDDAPKRKPSLEEIDALEVISSLLYFVKQYHLTGKKIYIFSEYSQNQDERFTGYHCFYSYRPSGTLNC